MHLKLTGIFGIWVLICAVLGAANFWEDKDFTSWSAEEVDEILTDSPWSKNVTVVVRGAGGRTPGFGTAGVAGDGDGGIRVVPDRESSGGHGIDGFGATPVRMTLTVAWRSALPVKQALARAQAGIGEPIPPAQQAFLIQHEPLYIVSVSGVPRQLAEVTRKTLLEQTALERNGKAPIVAEDVEPFFQIDETVILEFAFLRDDPIALADEEVKFVTTLGENEIERSFRLQDMMFGDALAM